MADYGILGKEVIRKDGPQKAEGSLKYMGDLFFDGMLYGRLVLPPVPHAYLKGIDCQEAEAMPGVVKVVTAADVKGTNLHGLCSVDQPSICKDHVRYLGDFIAVVVAETAEEAEKAVPLVKADYEVLPFYLTPEEALAPGAVVIHEQCPGNIRCALSHKKGDVGEGFEQSDIILENTYTSPYIEHAFLECEAGVARPLEDGGVELWTPTQYGIRARRQLSELLGIPLEKVHVHSHPLGGGFGGKDDLILQGAICACALACGKPVKIVLNREESFLLGPKRIPAKITMKTGVDKSGKLIAQKVFVETTSGAYDAYSTAILCSMLENVCGVYKVPNFEAEGRNVVTNNAYTTAMRGFGNNQVNFAIESQMNILAEKAGISPYEIRKINAAKAGERTAYGQKISPSFYSEKALDTAESSDLWQHREEWKKGAEHPWIRRGVGMALCQQGIGIGSVIPVDASHAELVLHEDGSLTVKFGNEDMGQGCITTLCMIASESLKIPYDRIDYVCGDTDAELDSGPITASRTTYITGRAVLIAAEKLKKAMADVLGIRKEDLSFEDGKVNGYTYQQLAVMLGPDDCTQNGGASFRNPDIEIEFGLHYMTSQLAQVSAVEVDTLTGQTKVVETVTAPASGKIINKLGYEGQCEGGIVMSQGNALYEKYRTKQDGFPLTKNFQTYMLPTISEAPKITILPVEDPEEDGPFGARGIGEPTSVPGTAAIAAAIYDAVGIRFCDLPCDQETVLMAIAEKEAEREGAAD